MHGYLNEHKGSFNPSQIRTLVIALDKAWEFIQASAVRFETGADAEAARATLAKYIIEAAQQGELDERRLRDGALVAWAQANLRNIPRAARQTAAVSCNV